MMLPTPVLALGMSSTQMLSLQGAAAVGMRADEAMGSFGAPAAILAAGNHQDKAVPVTWQGIDMRLDRGAWNIIYREGTVSGKESTTGWHNPSPAMPKPLSEVSSLKLVALGGIGIVTIDRAAHKTTYAIPDDLFRAHKIIQVEAQLKAAVPVGKILALYGTHNEPTKREDGCKLLRYWVLQEQDELPLDLHAVDFELSDNGNEVTGYTISGADVDYVQQKFSQHYKHWLDTLKD